MKVIAYGSEGPSHVPVVVVHVDGCRCPKHGLVAPMAYDSLQAMDAGEGSIVSKTMAACVGRTE